MCAATNTPFARKSDKSFTIHTPAERDFAHRTALTFCQKRLPYHHSRHFFLLRADRVRFTVLTQLNRSTTACRRSSHTRALLCPDVALHTLRPFASRPHSRHTPVCTKTKKKNFTSDSINLRTCSVPPALPATKTHKTNCRHSGQCVCVCVIIRNENEIVHCALAPSSPRPSKVRMPM